MQIISHNPINTARISCMMKYLLFNILNIITSVLPFSISTVPGVVVVGAGVVVVDTGAGLVYLQYKDYDMEYNENKITNLSVKIKYNKNIQIPWESYYSP